LAAPPEELELLLLDDELLLELLLDEGVLELELELLLDEELLGLELLMELDDVPEGTEHSFVPPATLVPVPKVTSPQTKLPLSTL
jgi:hypothetical protein